jgi:hypothetical protein
MNSTKPNSFRLLYKLIETASTLLCRNAMKLSLVAQVLSHTIAQTSTGKEHSTAFSQLQYSVIKAVANGNKLSRFSKVIAPQTLIIKMLLSSSVTIY